jgi:cysteine desulfurase
VSARGLRGEILLHMANDKGLIVGTGSACSSNAKHRYSKVILACGYDEKTTDGVLRLSFSSQTTEEEIVRAAEILNEIGRDLARRMK